MFRVLLGPQDETWDGNRAVLLDNHTGDKTQYEWVDEDKLLYLTFFDHDMNENGEQQVYSFRHNPIPEMWRDSGWRSPDVVLAELDMFDAI